MRSQHVSTARTSVKAARSDFFPPARREKFICRTFPDRRAGWDDGAAEHWWVVPAVTARSPAPLAASPPPRFPVQFVSLTLSCTFEHELSRPVVWRRRLYHRASPPHIQLIFALSIYCISHRHGTFVLHAVPVSWRWTGNF